MKMIGVIFIGLFFTAAAFADMTVVQTLKSDLMPGAQQNTMTMTVKGDKARIDLPASQMSSIIDAKAGKMFTLLHKQKQVMVVSLEDLKKNAALAAKTEQDKAKPVIKKTGKVDTIRGYKCAEYEFFGAGDNPPKIKCWITEEVDDSEMEVVRSFGGQMGGMFGFNDFQKPKGMVIRSEANMNINGRDIASASEVLSIKRDPVADGLFILPADYKTMEFPAFKPQAKPSGAQ